MTPNKKSPEPGLAVAEVWSLGHPYMHFIMFQLFKKKQRDEELIEFSTNFESEMVRPFLERILPFFESGFGPAQLEQVCQLVADLPHDQENRHEFKIRYAGKESMFRVEVFMDDLSAPDIGFFSPDGLTQKIRAEFLRFAKERGM